jgi:two-component system chemotaxis response regulator CheB
MISSSRVVVIAASVEGIDALARLINLLPSTFPAPLVVSVNGLRDDAVLRQIRSRLHPSSRLRVVSAAAGEEMRPGCLYMAPIGHDLVFTSTAVLGTVRSERDGRADRLFEAAALLHGRGVIGVVLGGLGKDGTLGLQAITEVDGIRIVQSPSEGGFSGMPSNALLGDNVQHTVMLDRMGQLLESLVADPRPDGVVPQRQPGG